MAKEKSIVEDAILQMKNLEEAVAENAKGILASTMKEEISELVKESLNEADEEKEEIDITKMGGIGNTEDSEEEEEDSEEEEEDSEEEEEDSEEEGMPIMPDDGDGEGIEIGDEEPIDLSHESDAEVLRVFQLMGPEDKLIVKKDSAGNINLRDTENDREYMIVGEGSEREETDEMFYETNEQEEYTGGETSEDFYFGDEEGEEEEEENEEEGGYSEEGEEDLNDVINTIFGDEKSETIYELEFSDKDSLEEEDEVSEIDGDDDSVFEIEFNEEDDDDDNQFYEQENPNIYESKMTSKAKGVGMGKPKFKYSAKPNMEGGFDKKTGKKADVMMGTGNAKKVKIYKDNTNMDGKMKVVKHGKKTETKEASRTLGNGRNWGRKGLPKPKASPRHIRLESTDAELQILRQKNDEYRKALNVFRNKLNEVAVFNSNLAYATRLFTEHSTSKQEKINILRRFDTVESLKESKNLYKQIKDELGTNKSEQLTESVERVIERAPSTGSSTTLIESKTYENPQFLRMKDLMSKIK